jgi:hypothetical protein
VIAATQKTVDTTLRLTIHRSTAAALAPEIATAYTFRPFGGKAVLFQGTIPALYFSSSDESRIRL